MSAQPKEGVYLDAALAVISEQIDERIDESSRRRHRRRVWGVAGLVSATVLSGSVAAYALTAAGTSGEASAPPVAMTAHSIACVDGTDAAATAYFTARYRVAADVEVSPTAICTSARAVADADVRALSPDAARALAGRLIAGAGDELATADVRVDAASFAVASSQAVGGVGVCAGDDGSLIVLATGAKADRSTWAMRCARAGLQLAGAGR
jgi:hypothetical protein